MQQRDGMVLALIISFIESAVHCQQLFPMIRRDVDAPVLEGVKGMETVILYKIHTGL